MQQIILRAFGIVGLVLCVIPFQFKKHKHIVLCKIASESVFAVQYLLLGAYTGACMDLISGLRNILFYKFVEKNKSTLPIIIVFSCLAFCLGIFSWAGIISLLPISGKILTTVSYGMKDEKLLRYIAIPSCVLWIIYNALVGCWEGLAADSLSLISILIAIYKYRMLLVSENGMT